MKIVVAIPAFNEEKNIAGIILKLKKFIQNYRLISVALILSISIIILISNLGPKYYVAKAVAVPIETESSSNLNNGLQGFASLIGGPSVSLANQNRFDQSIEILKTYAFFREFLSYLSENTKYVPDDIFLENLLYLGSKPRTEQELYEYFHKTILVIQHDQRKQILTLEFNSNTALASKELLDSLILSLDEYIKQKEVLKSSNAVSFLEDKISETTQSEIRTVLSTLVFENYKKLTLSESSPNYVFDLIDPPITPEKSRNSLHSFPLYFLLILLTFTPLLFLLRRYIK